MGFQYLGEADEPWIHQLLLAVAKHTGLAALINTRRHGAVPVLSGLVVDYFWIISGLFVDIYILIVTMVISVISGLNNSHGYSHVIAMCNLNCALRKAMVSVFNMGGFMI